MTHSNKKKKNVIYEDLVESFKDTLKAYFW